MPMNRMGAPSAAGARSGSQLGIATVVAVLVPFVVAVARGIQGGWVPVGDNALIAIRSGDVFSRHPPLLGTGSSISKVINDRVNNLGPLLFDLLAVPAKLVDTGAGLAVGVTLLNAVCVVGIALFAHRRGGALFTTAAMLPTAGVAWGMGSELLFEPWQPHSLMLPFLCFVVLVWSLACGDLAALSWAAVAGSLVIQTHLSYGFLVAALGAWGVAGLILELARRRRRDPDAWPALRTRVLRASVIATIVLAACWAQPVIEQLTSEGDGNMALLARNFETSEKTLGFGRGARLMAVVVALPPWLLQAGSAIRTPPSAATAAAAWGLLIAVFALCAQQARRLADNAAVYAIVTAVVALVAGLITAARTPMASPLLGDFSVAPHHVRWLWPVAAFVLFSVMATVSRAIARSPRRAAALAIAFAGAAGVLSAANLVERDRGTSSPPRSISVARAINGQMGTLEREGPLLVDAPIGFGAYGPAVMRELQRRGVPFVVASALDQLGAHRRFTGVNARARLTIKVGDDTLATPPGARRVAVHNGLTTKERLELQALANRVEQYGRAGGIRVSQRGKAAIAKLSAESGLPEPDDDDLVAQALDLFRSNILELDDQWRRRFERYDDLQARWDHETVALFLGPLDR